MIEENKQTSCESLNSPDDAEKLNKDIVEAAEEQAAADAAALPAPMSFVQESKGCMRCVGREEYVPIRKSGARYGLSVSIINRSSGTFFATSCKLTDFLNVTGPAKEIIQPSDR